MREISPVQTTWQDSAAESRGPDRPRMAASRWKRQSPDAASFLSEARNERADEGGWSLRLRLERENEQGIRGEAGRGDRRAAQSGSDPAEARRQRAARRPRNAPRSPGTAGPVQRSRRFYLHRRRSDYMGEKSPKFCIRSL